MHKVVRKIRRAILMDEPGYYDMYLNEGERFFARLYLHHIRELLAADVRPEPAPPGLDVVPLPLLVFPRVRRPGLLQDAG